MVRLDRRLRQLSSSCGAQRVRRKARTSLAGQSTTPPCAAAYRHTHSSIARPSGTSTTRASIGRRRPARQNAHRAHRAHPQKRPAMTRCGRPASLSRSLFRAIGDRSIMPYSARVNTSPPCLRATAGHNDQSPRRRPPLPAQPSSRLPGTRDGRVREPSSALSQPGTHLCTVVQPYAPSRRPPQLA